MTRPRNFEDILSKLTNARKSDDTWIAHCSAPGHRTPARHRILTDARDKALVTCHGVSHSYADICQALGFDSLTYSDNGKGEGRSYHTATVVNGVNVSTLAEAKRLPVDFLKSLGISNFKYNGQPSVKIPYYAEGGKIVDLAKCLSHRDVLEKHLLAVRRRMDTFGAKQ